MRNHITLLVQSVAVVVATGLVTLLSPVLPKIHASAAPCNAVNIVTTRQLSGNLTMMDTPPNDPFLYQWDGDTSLQFDCNSANGGGCFICIDMSLDQSATVGAPHTWTNLKRISVAQSTVFYCGTMGNNAAIYATVKNMQWHATYRIRSHFALPTIVGCPEANSDDWQVQGTVIVTTPGGGPG